MDELLLKGEQTQGPGNRQPAEQSRREPPGPAPDDSREWCRLGNNLVAAGLHVKGRKIFEAVLTREPACTRGWKGMARVHHASGRYEEALECWKTSALLDPSDFTARKGLGTTLNAMGRFDDAFQVFTSLAREFPDEEKPHIALAEHAMRNGDPCLAHRHLDLAIRINPDRVFMLSSVASLYLARGNLRRAQECLEKAAPDHPQRETVLAQLGWIRHLTGNHDKALWCWDALLAGDTDPYPTHIRRGLTLLALGRHEPARHAFLQARELKPAATEPYVCLARTERVAGTPAGASKWLRRMYRRHELSPVKIHAGPKPVRNAAETVLSPLRRTWRRLFKNAPPRPMVSVIMTTYNSAPYVREAIDSVLCQSYRNLELIVVDDASTDGTVDILQDRSRSERRLTLVLRDTNGGTYVSKNLGLLHTRGSLVTFHDSDDCSHPGRIERQVDELERQPEKVAVICDHVRVRGDGHFVEWSLKMQVRSAITLMFRASPVIRNLGFFDCTRAAADTEFIWRLCAFFGDRSLAHLPIPLYFARSHEDSLTSDATIGIRPYALSRPRQEYRQRYQQWHREIETGAASPYLPFPPRVRPFPVPDELRVPVGSARPAWPAGPSFRK